MMLGMSQELETALCKDCQELNQRIEMANEMGINPRDSSVLRQIINRRDLLENVMANWQKWPLPDFEEVVLPSCQPSNIG